MPFVAGLGTLLFFAAFLFSLEEEYGLGCTVQAVIKASPALFLASCVCYACRTELFTSEAQNQFPNQKKYVHYVAIGLIFFAIGDFALHMEKHPVYHTKLWFLAGLFSFLIGHIFMMFKLSFRSTELKCEGGNKLNLAFVAFILIIILSRILPKIVDDNLMKVCVLLYAFVIGRLLYFSLVLNHQEEKYYFSLLYDVTKMSKVQRDSPPALFIKLIANMFKGDIIGVQYGVKYYLVAATFMTVSDSILAYSRFVDQEDRDLYVWSTYFSALTFFALSALADQPCLPCFTRVIYQETMIREGYAPNPKK